jgi:hypothetical protein
MFTNIRAGLLLALCVLSFQSTASSDLGRHVLAVSQSMSAFYMYSLSEGDKRYQDEYQEHFDDAQSHLASFQSQDAVVANELQVHWDKLRPELKYEYIDGAGFIIPVTVRNQFRNYLGNAFSKYLNASSNEQSSTRNLAQMALSVEVMSARFFDVSSALYGTMSISNTDNMLDPVKMSKKLNYSFDQVQKSTMNEKVKRTMRLVQTKWRFIEDSVINYKDEAAYLLVYYNKSQIHKLLNKSQRLLAGA